MGIAASSARLPPPVDPHHTWDGAHTQSLVEGHHLSVAQQRDVIVALETGEQSAHEFARDASPSISGQYLQERDVRHEPAVTEGIDEPDDSFAVSSHDNASALAKHTKMT